MSYPQQPNGEQQPYGPPSSYPQPGYGQVPYGQQPPYGQPMPGYWPAPVPPTNGMAIAALILVFVFFPLGLIFGYIARGQIRRTGEGGAGLAAAAETCRFG